MVGATNSKQASSYPLPAFTHLCCHFFHWQQQVWTGIQSGECYTWNLLILQLDKVSESVG